MTDWYFAGRERIGMPVAGSAEAADSLAYSNFIARTTGLDATHLAAYRALLNGLTTDGLFNSDGTSSYFDILYIFATQDETNAVLNLVSSSFAVTPQGSPNFAADDGYLGVDTAFPAAFLDTNYNPSTQGTNYTQNSAHMSAWSMSDTISSADGGAVMGSSDPGNGFLNQLSVRYFGSGSTNSQINMAVAAGANFTDADSLGHYIAGRSASNSVAVFKNGVSQDTDTEASATIPNVNLYILARNAALSGAVAGTDRRLTMASAGKNLGGLESAFYGRLRTYMTAVGVP